MQRRNKKIDFHVRSWLFSRGFRAANQKPKHVPLFALTDLFYIPLMGWKNINHIMEMLGKFQLYRQNLHSRSWSSLTEYYPRSLYLWYYYQLFWWADFCEVSDELLARPNNSIVAELFIRYFVEIDSLIDRSEGKSLLRQINRIKSDPSIENILQELLTHISLSDLTSEIKKTLCHQIWTYRQNSLSVCVNALNRAQSKPSEVISDKEQTVGEMFSVWAATLNHLYCVKSSDLARSSEEILANIAMAVQVLDDMLDLPVDYQEKIDNLFYEFLKQTPNELERAIQHLQFTSWKHLDWKWAKTNLPRTCSYAFKCIDEYLERAIRIGPKLEMTKQLCGIVKGWSRNALGSGESALAK